MDPTYKLNYHGQDWVILRTYLSERMESCMSRLCSDLSLDETNKVRGELSAIRDILSLESAAQWAARE